VLAVVSIESSFNPKARSPKGAQGLMQVLTRVHTDKFAPFGGATAAFDPVANLSVGSRILKEYLVREGSIEGALKSYVGAALLPHDFGYGSKVLSERERIAAAATGRSRATAQFPEAGRTAANSGVPGESKAIPVFEVFNATPGSDMPPPVSGDASGNDAVDQLLKNLSVL
jgi:soluble lytic murein transglycosylase-like protein